MTTATFPDHLHSLLVVYLFGIARPLHMHMEEDWCQDLVFMNIFLHKIPMASVQTTGSNAVVIAYSAI